MNPVIDHLWQSTLFALAAALLTLALRGNAARMRYWVWFAASVKFLLPFTVLVAVGNSLGGFMQVPAEPLPLGFVLDVAATPAVPTASLQTTVVIFAIWLAGFFAVLVLWMGRYRRILALVRAAEPGQLPAKVAIKFSSQQVEPGLVGILRPILLLPTNIDTSLAPDELASIIAHEHCHLRHRDNLTAAIHMLVQALFWFHPLVWWIGARLISERERACDEAVLASGNDPGTYAEAILKVCRLYVRSPLICASGVSGADLKQRVEEIMMNRRTHSVGRLKKVLLAAVALAVVGTPIFLGWADMPGTSAQAAAPSPLSSTEPAVVPPRADPARPNMGPDAFYPAESIAAREQGSAVLLLTVDAAGDVIAAKVEQSSGFHRLDDAAVAAALEHWRFMPGTINGTPAEMQVKIRITFKV
jgi:TonB family protein